MQRLLGRCRNVVKTPEELRPRHRFTASGSCRRQRVTVDVRGEPHQSRGGHPSENVQYAGPAEVDDHDVRAAPDEVLRSRDEACAGQYSGNLRAIDEIGRVRHCLNHGDLPVWVVPTLCSQLPHRREIRCHLGQGADGVGQHGPKAALRHELTNPHRNGARSAQRPAGTSRAGRGVATGQLRTLLDAYAALTGRSLAAATDLRVVATSRIRPASLLELRRPGSAAR